MRWEIRCSHSAGITVQLRRNTQSGANYKRQARELADASLRSSAVSQIRIWGAGSNIRNQVSDLNSKYIDNIRKYSFHGLCWNIAGSIFFLAIFSILAFNISRFGIGGPGEFAVLIILGLQIGEILYGLSQSTGIIGNSLHSVRRIRDVERLINKDSSSGTDCHRNSTEELKFENLSFSYDYGKKNSLEELSISMKPGEVIGIVGENGAGKTTLVRLALGLVRPSSGESVLYGTGYYTGLLQDYIRPEFLLKDAIGFGSSNDSWTDNEILNVANDSRIVDMINNQPKGIETQLGTSWGGVNLSGGQWQQLALARALMRKDAQLVVLDEPTSSISPDNEYEMLSILKETIRSIKKTRQQIGLIVSHRLSLMTIVDKIVVLEKGKIVEFGSHEELVSVNCGHYRNMFEAQVFEFE